MTCSPVPAARFWHACAAILIGLLVVGVSRPASAWPSPVSESRFGVTGPASGGVLDDLGVGWQQVALGWRTFYPRGLAGGFDAQAAPVAQVREAMAAGREVVLLLADVPATAGGPDGPSPVPDGLALPSGDPDNVWGDYIGALVRTFAPLGVHHWVILDEPDVRAGEGRVRFAGEVADYARLLRVAYEAAHAVDPQAVIHVAAMNRWVDQAAGRTPYLQRLITTLEDEPDARENGLFFDVVTVRALAGTASVESLLAETRAILASADLADKAIWVEANAWPTLDGPDAPDGVFGITAAQQADFVVQAVAVALAGGAERFALAGSPAWPDAGLIAATGTPRPALAAYRRAIARFETVTGGTSFAVLDVTGARLATPDGTMIVAWTTRASPARLYVIATAPDELAISARSWGQGVVRRAEPFDWRDAFSLDLPAASPDPHGFWIVGGPPALLMLAPTGTARSVYIESGGVLVRVEVGAE